MEDRYQRAYFHWALKFGFDRQLRLGAFRRLAACRLIYLIFTLYWEHHWDDSFFTLLAILFTTSGLITTSIVEYLATIRLGWPRFEYRLGLTADVSNLFGTILGGLPPLGLDFLDIVRYMDGLDPEDKSGDYRSIMAAVCILTFHIYCLYQVLAWGNGFYYSVAPIHFQIRRQPSRAADRDGRRMLYVVVWYHQDRCELFHGQWGGFPFIDSIQMPDSDWPTMDETPPWIVMKLSDEAVAAG